MSAPQEPFERDELLDKPGIVGARWWHRGLAEPPSAVSRRKALGVVLATGGGLATAAVAFSVLGESCSSDDTAVQPMRALELQRTYGWSFGAALETVTFDGESKRPFDRAALVRMPEEFRPADEGLRAYYVPALFESPASAPTLTAAGDPAPITPLRDVLRPIFTPAMDQAYRRGKALASLVQGAATDSGPRLDLMVVVDLPGPESVAFAAGAASALDPVFTFDNWPHPRGVVPAHLTLAAAAYYQPLFARAGASGRRPAMFVLDLQRLRPYTDDASQFDNRYIVRLPSTAMLRGRGVRRVLYVVKGEIDLTETDDLNEDFVAYAAAGIDVKICAARAFQPEPSAPPPVDDTDEKPRYYYGGRPESHLFFWLDYPWAPRPEPLPVQPGFARPGVSYVPRPRSTAFSGAAAGGGAGARPLPPDFGMVPVVVAAGTGAVLGAALSRSGSWNRASGGSGG